MKCLEDQAKQARLKANDVYKMKDFSAALNLYDTSIRYAVINSECYFKSLSNKSAVLFEMKSFKQCLEIIDFLFSTELEFLAPFFTDVAKDRLNKRKALCLHFVGDEVLASHPSKEFLGFSSILEKSDNIELNISEDRERSLVSKRDMNVGEDLFKESAFATSLAPNLWDQNCYGCFKSTVLGVVVPCESCSNVQYCSLACRKKDFIHQKVECTQMSFIKDIGMAHLAVKVFLHTDPKTLNDKVFSKGKTDQIKAESVNDDFEDVNRLVLSLSYNENVFENISKEFDDNAIDVIVRKFITPFYPLIAISILSAHLMTILAQMYNNASTIQVLVDDEMISVGCGIYPTLALANHSCYNNTLCLFNDGDLTVKSTVAIPAGQEVFNTYGPNFEFVKRDERQSTLFQHYGFVCRCIPCEKDWVKTMDYRSVKCNKCSTDFTLSAGVDCCTHCNDDITALVDSLSALEEWYNRAYEMFQEKRWGEVLAVLKNPSLRKSLNSGLRLPDTLALDWNDLGRKCLIKIFYN